MKAQIKNLDLNGDLNLDEFSPSSNEIFSFYITAGIGCELSEEKDNFQILICSKKWEDNELQSNREVSDSRIVIDFDFNIHLIKLEIRRKIEACHGNDWQEVITQLRQIAEWEYENYIE